MIGDSNLLGAPGTEHQSSWSGGHEDWRPGITCDECQERKEANAARFGKSNVLVSGLQRMKDYDYTSVDTLEKKAIADARAMGIEPERYTG
jgi:hypothetical protein